jgi:Ca2+-binding RTX toxin-like protein
MSHRKFLLGTLAAAAAIVSVPSAASAATCTYDSTEKRMDVRYRAGETSNTIRNGTSILYSDGGLLRSCFDPATGKAATATNTAKVIIKAATGTGAQQQTTTIDESVAGFADLNPALDLFVLTGTNDRLVLKEGAAKDNLRLQEQTDGLAFGPLIDLNYDLNPDLRMTTSNSIVEVDAGGGDDLIDGSEVKSYRTVQLAEAGNDVLVGGAKPDSFNGGSDTDRIFSKDGILEIVDGGSGTDTATIDSFEAPTSIEQVLFN